MAKSKPSEQQAKSPLQCLVDDFYQQLGKGTAVAEALGLHPAQILRIHRGAQTTLQQRVAQRVARRLSIRDAFFFDNPHSLPWTHFRLSPADAPLPPAGQADAPGAQSQDPAQFALDAVTSIGPRHPDTMRAAADWAQRVASGQEPLRDAAPYQLATLLWALEQALSELGVPQLLQALAALRAQGADTSRLDAAQVRATLRRAAEVIRVLTQAQEG